VKKPLLSLSLLALLDDGRVPLILAYQGADQLSLPRAAIAAAQRLARGAH
jgi:hypothetical protein